MPDIYRKKKSQEINNGYDPVYLDTRKEYIESMYDQRDKLDTYLLNYSAGVFGVSILFIKQLVGDLNNCNILWALVASWLIFAINIVIVLISFHISEKDFEKMIKKIDKGEEPQPSKFIDWINRISIILFATGVALIIAFTILNSGVSKWQKKEERKEVANLLLIQNQQGTIPSLSLDEKE